MFKTLTTFHVSPWSLALLGALCYAELGTSFTKSGGHYTYLLETLGPLPAFLRLWVEFLFIRLVGFILSCLFWLQVKSHHIMGRFSISRPAVASYVSLAFGRYVVEPFFAPCAAPTVLIRLVSILGVSEWFYTSSLSPKHHYTSLYVINMNFSFTVCLCSVCRGSQLLECDNGLSHSGHLDFH